MSALRRPFHLPRRGNCSGLLHLRVGKTIEALAGVSGLSPVMHSPPRTFSGLRWPMLATVMGEILFNEGQFTLARHWYGVARCAALEVATSTSQTSRSRAVPICRPIRPTLGRFSTMWTRASKQSMRHHRQLPGYGDSRRKRTPCWVTGTPSRQQSARRTVRLTRRQQNLSGRASFRSCLKNWPFYEARGQVELGNTEKASEAAERAISLYDPSETTEPARTCKQVRFAKAVGWPLRLSSTVARTMVSRSLLVPRNSTASWARPTAKRPATGAKFAAHSARRSWR